MDLIADIGATNARCALLDDKGNVVALERYRNADLPGIEALLDGYLERRRTSDRPRRAALAVAAPILADHVQMTNIDWSFSQAELKIRLGLNRLVVVNDFTAVAWGLPKLEPEDVAAVGRPKSPEAAGPLAVLGPGSGLGVASTLPTADGWAVASGEGGHVTMPAATDEEAAVVALLRAEHGHCSAERLLSGPGLVNLYGALARLAGRGVPTVTPLDVTGLAARGEPLARKTLDVFFGMLGTVAGNLALTVGATGGVYVAGGIVPNLLDALHESAFRERFEAKGRYRGYMEPIPTYVVTQPLPAFRGLRTLLGYP